MKYIIKEAKLGGICVIREAGNTVSSKNEQANEEVEEGGNEVL